MPQTRIFSIYDDSGEKAVITLTGETVEDLRDIRSFRILDEQGKTVAGTLVAHGLKVREVK
jgi:hypothetical protein